MKLQLTYQFENEDELRAHLAIETRAVSTSPIQQAASAEEGDSAGRSTEDSMDADGMPYDESVHADPPSCTADGLWRAKRGKADEAKAARAAFKARGGNIVAPTMPPIAATVAPVEAVVSSAPAMPGMPGVATLPPSAPEPVSMERVIDKITGMIKRGVLQEQVLAGMYQKHSGVTDPAASFGIFNSNESARANLFGDLCHIEPELS